MTLEPENSQIALVAAVLPTRDIRRAIRAAEDVWLIIRDQVLDAAIREVSLFQDRCNRAAAEGPPHLREFEACHANGAANCAAILHAMKSSIGQGRG